MKYIIIGGVAGGATAAARIRRNSEEAKIVLIEKGEHISYANCGLPYYIGNVISDREKLFVQTPQAFAQRFNIDVRVKSEVIAIDRIKKAVKIKGADGKTYMEAYDKLLLSPGASPVRPPLPGIDIEGIFTLRDVNDTDTIKNYIRTNDIKRAIIIGGGFIGLEMAENLHNNGSQVAVVEMANQVMAPIDFSMASLVHQHLLQKGIRLYLGTAVTSFERNAEGISVVFQNGRHLSADMIILSIGVRPNTMLASQAGIELGEMRGIKVNCFLQTSDENIYAVGDAIEYPHPITDKPWLNYLAGPANRQARIVADNMVFGNKIKYEGAIGTSIAKVFDLTVAATGMSAKRLKQLETEYLSATIHPSSHAGYYPDALPMSIKIVFAPKDGRLLGAQIVGFEGVDKRIDEFSQVIKNNGSIYNLMSLEHAYAPPYSSAKDPVAVTGYVAGNILSGKMSPIYWRQLKDTDINDITLIDVRTPDEFNLGAINGAINIPLDNIRHHLNDIPKNKPIVLYCGVGLRGYLASNILRQNGFNDVRNLIGGLKTYTAAVTPLPDAKPFDDGNVCNSDTTNLTDKSVIKNIHEIDACGLSCPGPIMKLKQSIEKLGTGEQLQITATDPGFVRDAEAWCHSTGNHFISSSFNTGKYSVLIKKKDAQHLEPANNGKGKTFILFSDDLDKALATFVLANGAAATGEKVTIFFTFWGLNVIKKDKKPKVNKDIFGKMFGIMLPSRSMKLKLSKMNMGGIGRKMMRYIMKTKNIESLETLRSLAIENGVEFIACQMSMDVMGVKREELLDNVTIGGVATYMNRADNANVNLFI
ncbi:MAG: DsrE/DsrF/DrsH-like family protein [Prevotella sp.]|nr:DsrE/DsrF/DrsH-like family protein [Prevotella sp.]